MRGVDEAPDSRSVQPRGEFGALSPGLRVRPDHIASYCPGEIIAESDFPSWDFGSLASVRGCASSCVFI